MGTRLGIVTETFIPAEDHTWLGSAHGTNECDTVTIDGDAFLATFTDGIVPSGVVLALDTDISLYVPYVGTAAKSTVTVDATAGNWTITIDGETSAAVAFNVSTANLLIALNAMSNINAGDVTVSGGPGASGGGTPYVITFVGGAYADDVPAVTVADSTLTGGGDAVSVVNADATGLADTRSVAKGFLFTTTDLGGISAGTVGNVPVPLYWHGEVIEANLPTSHGLDARAKADLNQIRFV